MSMTMMSVRGGAAAASAGAASAAAAPRQPPKCRSASARALRRRRCRRSGSGSRRPGAQIRAIGGLQMSARVIAAERGRAVAGSAVGAVAVERARRGHAGDLARIAHRDPDRVDRDRPLPLQLLGRRASRCGRCRRRCASARSASEVRTVRPSDDAVPAGAAAERRAERLDRRGRSRAAERVAVPSVITAAVRLGGAGAAGRIGRRAAARDQRDADQRQTRGSATVITVRPLASRWVPGRGTAGTISGPDRRRRDALGLGRRLHDRDVGRRGQRRRLRPSRRWR